MTTQIYNAELVELLRSIFPDRQSYAQFQSNINANWYDYRLNDTTDGEHFNENNSTYPPTWTEVDASVKTTTDLAYGFWRINSNGSDQTWKYRKQLSFSIESLPDATWTSINWGPILYRDTGNANDETAYFGLYADNSGSINEDVFIRVALNWDATAGLWQVRGEYKDGTTQTDGSWYLLSENPQLPGIFIRTAALHFTAGTGETKRAYVGSNPIPLTHTSLVSPSQNATWGQPWIQMHYTRGAGGTTSILFIGAVDLSNDA